MSRNNRIRPPRPRSNPGNRRRDSYRSMPPPPPPPPPPPGGYYERDEVYDHSERWPPEETGGRERVPIRDPESFKSDDDIKMQKRPPINGGTIIALIGFFVLIIGILLPMYHLSYAADIQTSTPTIDVNGTVTGNKEIMNYSTNGTKDLLIIGGTSGIELNMPNEEGDIDPLFQSSFPYGYIYVVLLIITIVLGLISKSPTKRGRKYIVSGFLALIPIFIILIIVSQLGNIVGEDRLEPPLDDFVEALSSGPMGGALPLNLDYSYDTEATPPGTEGEPVKVTSTARFHTSITWGLSLGGYLIILGSIIVIAGGVIDIHISRVTAMRLSAYREAMYRTYEDLHLSPDEVNIIIGLRKNLKITDKEHKMIKNDVMKQVK
ncbi:MAG: hypothetical protein JSV49_09865 [Thermoplasmata archaeon]|nr:MAG: hypothetical protein JSV49_09865 [Thermoplasmata archaeon]